MPRVLVRLLAIALIVTTLFACGIGQGTTVDHARATLDGWGAIGLACTGPTTDNVPGGLVQWSCRGMRQGVELLGVLDGNDRGVVSLQFVVDAATGPETAADAFARLVEATPPLDGHEAEIVAFIARWPSIETTGSFGTSRVRVDVDEIWRTLDISMSPAVS